MILTFSEALQKLGPDAILRIANAARPPGDYLFQSRLLPMRQDYSYKAESGTMTVRTTMAGLVGMDSAYPPGGLIEESTFSESTAKVAITSTMKEGTLRKVQAVVRELRLSGGNVYEALVQEIFNFTAKVGLQAVMDTVEWLCGQALCYGEIDWTFNKKRLLVDYGIPDAQKLTERSGNDRYGGSTSKFWTDHFEALRLLAYMPGIRGFMSSRMMHSIVANSYNDLELIGLTGTTFTVRRRINQGGVLTPDTDPRATFQFELYDAEGEIMDLANPGQTVKIPFLPATKIIYVAPAGRRGYVVGQGATASPTDPLALGYTHVAPTVEGNGALGMWARAYTPEARPMQLTVDAVENVLPVVENTDKLVIATSSLS